MKRKLTVNVEKLADLATEELGAVHGAAPPTLRQGCQIRSDLFYCVTYGYCPPPPAPGA